MTFRIPLAVDFPSDRRCLKLEIPDSDEWHHLFLSWIHVASKGGSYIVEQGSIRENQKHWREIFDSIEACSGEQSGGESEQETNEIIRIIKQELINNMCGCSCCSNGGVMLEGVSSAEDLIPDDIGIGDVPNDVTTPTDSGFDSRKCKIAQYILDAWYGAVLNMRNLVAIGEQNTSDVQVLIDGAFDIVDGGELYSWLWTQYYTFASHMFATLSETQTTAIRAYINENRGELVSVLFCSTSASNAKQGMIDHNSAYAGTGTVTKLIIRVWLEMLPYEALYQTASQWMNAPAHDRVESSYLKNCVCGSVGGTPDADLPAGYALVAMGNTSIGSTNGGLATNAGAFYEFTGQGNAFAEVVIDKAITYEGVSVPLANIVGFYFVLVEASITNGNSVSHRFAGGGNEIYNQDFGSGVNTWLVGEVHAGAVASDATLQAWLTASSYRWKSDDATTDTTDEVVSMGIWGGSTGSGSVNEFIQESYLIIKIPTV